jgi:hypothetical protein
MQIIHMHMQCLAVDIPMVCLYTHHPPHARVPPVTVLRTSTKALCTRAPYQYQSGMHAQVAYTQQTLVPDVPAFVRLVRASLGPGSGAIVIDGYHAFGALPTVQRLAGFESRSFDCPSLARTKGIGHKGMTRRVDRVWY